MTRIALALLTLPLLASPAGAATPYDGLRVELRRTSPARIAPGDPVQVTARLVNRSDRAVEVVKPSDGSEMGWREPWVYFTAERTRPDGVVEPVPKGLVGRCGLYDYDWTKDVVRLAPGASIELNTWIPEPSRMLALDGVGRVAIRMHYAFGMAPGKGHLGTPPERRPAPMAGVAPFEVVSDPVEVTIASPLTLEARLRPGAPALRAGKPTRLAALFDLAIVNTSDRPVEVRTPGTPTTFRLEARPDGVVVGVEGPTPVERVERVVIPPGGRLPLLGPGARFSKRADGTWTPRDAGSVAVTLVFDEGAGATPGHHLASAPVTVEVAPAR